MTQNQPNPSVHKFGAAPVVHNQARYIELLPRGRLRD